MKKKVLILVNHDLVIYNFRKELVEKLIELDYKVIISSPDGPRIPKLIKMGAQVEKISINRHGMNPINEVRLLYNYFKLLKEHKPDVVLSYTVKPNTYGGIVSRAFKIPFIPNITGLGNAVNSEGIINKIIIFLYRFALSKSYHVFFQNKSNMEYLTNKINILDSSSLLPGSGVNLEEFQYKNYPQKNKQIRILYFGRLMESKGILDLLEAIKVLNNNSIKFQFLGFFDDEKLKIKFMEYKNEYNIELIEHTSEVSPYIEQAHAVILPSHHEGMSNSLLEAAAVGRPLLASNIPGCKEIIDNDINGYLFEPKDPISIVEIVNKFIKLDYNIQKNMGKNSRLKVEREFNREIVIQAYVKKIESILEGK